MPQTNFVDDNSGAPVEVDGVSFPGFDEWFDWSELWMAKVDLLCCQDAVACNG